MWDSIRVALTDNQAPVDENVALDFDCTIKFQSSSAGYLLESGARNADRPINVPSFM
jgi:hypothetical protein